MYYHNAHSKTWQRFLTYLKDVPLHDTKIREVQALSQAQAEDKNLEELSEPTKTSEESNQPEANHNLEWNYGAASNANVGPMTST